MTTASATLENVTFTTTHGDARNGRYSILIVATYTARSGRKISAQGWTYETAVRNLTRKLGLA